MSTDLEKYLRDQRKALDVDTPDDQVIWEGIRKDLQQAEFREDRKKIWIRIRNIAAVAVIVLSLGYIVTDLIRDRRQHRSISLADIDTKLGKREQEYRTKVSYMQNEAGIFNHVDHVIIAELLEEIERLDTIYEQSLKDLNELGYNEQVINTIFDTYERKIYLLELIILENNKIKNIENDENLFL